MAKFFVSYSRSDTDLLNEIVPHIRTVFGISCLWFDDQIPGAADWWQMILSEIEKCELFIFLISDDAAESDYCQQELRKAIELSKPILPIIIRRFTVGYPGNIPDDLRVILAATQYIDLGAGLTDIKQLSKLWAAIIQLEQLSKSRKAEPIELKRFDRWTLSNQFRILAKLYPKESESYEELCEIVERGYELNYDWITEYIYDTDSIMSRDECLEVLNILEMFSCLQSAYEIIIDKSGINNLSVQFAGFDGNYETKYMAYTRFVVDREGKFNWIERNQNFNSHYPVLKRYRLMLVEWENSTDKYNLSKDDVIRISSVTVW